MKIINTTNNITLSKLTNSQFDTYTSMCYCSVDRNMYVYIVCNICIFGFHIKIKTCSTMYFFIVLYLIQLVYPKESFMPGVDVETFVAKPHSIILVPVCHVAN